MAMVEEIEGRLTRLERANRIHRAGWATAALLTSALVTLGQGSPPPVPHLVSAQAFELKDKAGKVRAALGVSEDGGTYFNMLDRDGKARASVVVLSDGSPLVAVRDASGKSEVALFSSATGTFGVRLQHGEGARLLLRTDKDGTPTVGLYDAKQRARAGVLLLADSSPAFVSFSADGKVEWDSRRAAATTTTSDRVRASVSGLSYAGVGDGHWIQDVVGSGKFIKLEDDSLWEVSPLDTIDSSLWLPISDITVIEGSNPAYPYKLVNTDDGEVVEAKLISQ